MTNEEMEVYAGEVTFPKYKDLPRIMMILFSLSSAYDLMNVGMACNALHPKGDKAWQPKTQTRNPLWLIEIL